MRHPADSPAWKEFDARYPDFAQDPRNVRLGLATDGFNPFGDKNNAYSIWPVILVVYNMSAFEFLKQEYFMLTLLISGPSSPGNNIDVYLRPLIDELKDLWTTGIETYDAHSGEVFQMHAAILWTINDFPAYGYLSGWSTSGYKACPRCLDDTSSIRLRDKIGFLCHRRFLRIKHPWRRNKSAFNGKVEKRGKPKEWNGSDILKRLRSHEHLFDKLEKRPKKKRKFDSILSNWRKISIFNELPYLPYNKLPHNIDVMHVEKTVSESLTGTIFGIDGKSKDTVKAREELRDMGIRSELHIQDDGKKPKACCTLSPEDRKPFCDFLRSVKFPDGYASNISRCVKDGKIQGLKSHDYHVFLQRLLGIGVRGFLNIYIWLCCRMYMDEVHQTDVQNMTNMHEEQFRFWLKSHINRLHDDRSQEVTRELWALANGPIPFMTRFYNGCIVNQVRFHTKDWDDVHTTQNSGVVVEGHHHGELIDFYGFMQKVVELTFYDGYKVVLLQCEWYNTGSATTCKRDKHFVSIDVRSRWYKDQPFVLPNQVEQVFYVNDTKYGPNWQIVQRVQHRHLWNLSNEEDPMEEVNNQEQNEVFQQYECREVIKIDEDDDISVLQEDDDISVLQEDEVGFDDEVGLDDEWEEDEDNTAAIYYDSDE